jgi:hypothetical protein
MTYPLVCPVVSVVWLEINPTTWGEGDWVSVKVLGEVLLFEYEVDKILVEEIFPEMLLKGSDYPPLD